MKTIFFQKYFHWENYLLNESIFGKKTLDIYCFNLILSMYLYLCVCVCIYLYIRLFVL